MNNDLFNKTIKFIAENCSNTTVKIDPDCSDSKHFGTGIFLVSTSSANMKIFYDAGFMIHIDSSGLHEICHLNPDKLS